MRRATWVRPREAAARMGGSTRFRDQGIRVAVGLEGGHGATCLAGSAREHDSSGHSLLLTRMRRLSSGGRA